MGCSIHLHVEVKIDDEWHHWGAPSIGQDYELFEKMAGAHGDERNAITPPRGLPDDITKPTKFDVARWDDDGHSHSWLSVDEIDLLRSWWESRPGSVALSLYFEEHLLAMHLFGNSLTEWHRYPDENREGVQDVRFVFWFDN